MAEFITDLFCKNVEQEQFKEWIEEKETAFSWYYTKEDRIMKDWDVGICYESGHGGYFWESMALEMVSVFNGIVFEGHNSVGDQDGMVITDFVCDGKEVTITRSVEIPSEDDEYDEYDEDIRAYLEADNDIPYTVNFSVDEVIACFEIYKAVGKSLNDKEQVESICDKHKVDKERFMLFVTIWDYEVRPY